MSHYTSSTIEELEFFSMPVASISSEFDTDSPIPGYFTTTIKVQKCSLACKYCDSMYLAKPVVTYLYPLKDVYKAIIDEKAKYVKIIGGDPLLYRDQIICLSKNLIEAKKIVNIYLTGSQNIKDFLDEFWSNEQKNIILTLNWKSISSGEASKMNSENLKYLRDNDILTFKVQSSEDLNQMKDIVSLTKCKNIFVKPVNNLRSEDVLNFVQMNIKELSNIRLW